jgi:hypothetical protein
VLWPGQSWGPLDDQVYGVITAASLALVPRLMRLWGRVSSNNMLDPTALILPKALEGVACSNYGVDRRLGAISLEDVSTPRAKLAVREASTAAGGFASRVLEALAGDGAL